MIIISSAAVSVNGGAIGCLALLGYVFSRSLNGGTMCLEGFHMRNSFTLIILAALVLGLVLLGLADTPTSVADTDLPDGKDI